MPVLEGSQPLPDPGTGVDWLDAVLSAIPRDPMGGLGPGSAVVKNAEHPVFQMLLQQFPKVARALQRMPSTAVFENDVLPTSMDMRNIISQGAVVNGSTTPIPIPGSAREGYRIWLNPAQTPQPRGLTAIHEVLHALYGDKGVPRMTPPLRFAHEILRGQPARQMFPNLGDPSHQALHGMAERIWNMAP